eukprot:1970958-Pleurochrysis_carterae.AAC.2
MHRVDSRKPSMQREGMAGGEALLVYSQITKAIGSLGVCQDRKGKAQTSLHRDAHERRRHAAVRASGISMQKCTSMRLRDRYKTCSLPKRHGRGMLQQIKPSAVMGHSSKATL